MQEYTNTFYKLFDQVEADSTKFIDLKEFVDDVYDHTDVDLFEDEGMATDFELVSAMFDK